MEKTVIGVFSSERQAKEAVEALREKGFEREISIIAKQENRGEGSYRKGRESEITNDSTADGAVTGGVIGGIGGLALSAGLIAIPGIGPLLAAGPLAATLGGAAAGGLAGGLIDYGIPEEHSRHYEKSVQEGDILTIVKCSREKADIAQDILRRYGAKDIEVH
ncbi:MAG TPA: hypothetical protein GXX38_05955 [Clostridia bacterium]|nr:hypothetical protein [Clostridia bacterium]